MTQPVYPFAAIVGQETLKQALLLCALDPTLGGVLIRGDKGSAKSTAARGLPALLPPLRRVAGCAFNCAPDAPLDVCPACQSPDRTALEMPPPFVNLPLGATEDRVLGSLDFEAALKQGRQGFRPGLLAGAHRGILYIDEVNLLADHLVDVLLDVAAMGQHTIEREGLSLRHPARISLIGTMNPEEGNLRPQLLDRFGLMVEVSAPRDAAARSEVVRRRLAYETDPAGFARQWQAATDALAARVAAARHRLPEVVMPDSLLDFISRLCCEFEVASLRADIVLYKAARGLAALDGRDAVCAEDIRDAARLVLPHRRRHKPFEEPGLDQDKLDALTRDQSPSAPPPGTRPDPTPGDVSGDTPADTPAGAPEPPPQGAGEDATGDTPGEVFAVGRAGATGHLAIDSRLGAAGSGRRSRARQATAGQYVRAVPDPAPDSLAIDATLRHALRRAPGPLQVTRADLHRKERIGQQGNLILLVVDASGSMAARRRMEAVKGCVLTLLTDAYQRRDQVGVIAFRGHEAELLLAPTRQVENARHALDTLPTGGRTPLAQALTLAGEVLARQAGTLRPLLVLISDGRANVSQRPDGDPWREALDAAGHLAAGGWATLVLDTEDGLVRLGQARQLAEALQAEYQPMTRIHEEELHLTIRERLSR